MMGHAAIIRFGALALLYAGVLGCGSDSELLDSSLPRVDDVRVDPASVKVGEQIQVRVAFSPQVDTKTDIVTGEETSETREATVVIRLPEGFDFVEGSSKTDNSAFDGFETRNPNAVRICPDNSRVLTYSFEGRELSTFDNQILFVAQAYQPEGTVLVEGYASFSVTDSCAAVGEAVESVTIVAP